MANNSGDWLKVYIPQSLIIAALIGGATYAYRVGEATEENARAIDTKAEATDVAEIKRDVEQIQVRQLEQAGGINYIGDAVQKIAAKEGIDLPPRPIVSEDP